MVLLNDPASLPTPMWAVTRYLLTTTGDSAIAPTRTILSPAALLPEEKANDDKTFIWAVETLRMLGLVATDGDSINLAQPVRQASPVDFTSFADLLRQRVLDPARIEGIADNGDQTGPRDLARALAWFLTLDPLVGYSFDEIEQRQIGAFPQEIGVPFVNDFRWGRFVYWAPMLGFAASPLLPGQGRSVRIAPDCTVAVRRTIRQLWNTGDHLAAGQAIAQLLEQLPVLPGGRLSAELGLSQQTTTVSSALSFALLCGHDHGWIRLETRSDAAHDVVLVDPDTATGTRRVTDLTVLEESA